MERSLYNILKYEKWDELTDSEKDSLFDLLAKYCRSEMRQKIWRRIQYIFMTPNVGIFQRVYFENGKAFYCGGQSYPDEIRLVRKYFLARKKV